MPDLSQYRLSFSHTGPCSCVTGCVSDVGDSVRESEQDRMAACASNESTLEACCCRKSDSSRGRGKKDEKATDENSFSMVRARCCDLRS